MWARFATGSSNRNVVYNLIDGRSEAQPHLYLPMHVCQITNHNSTGFQTTPQTTDYTVYGTGLKVDGTPLVDYVVRAVVVDIRSKRPFGTTHMNIQTVGSYVIPYYPVKVTPLERGSADFKIYVYDPVNQDAPRAKSEIKFDAPKDCSIVL
jgi:hypothetical protein